MVALGTAFFFWKARRNFLALPDLPLVEGEYSADVTVIIPARNEERNIERAVRSFPGLPVSVVDDRSEDKTAAVAREAGAVVLRAPDLKAGALGKPSACAAGARDVQTEWLLFVDADTWYQIGFVYSLLRYAEARDLAAVSVFLRQERITLFERMLLPYAFALYFCGVNSSRVHDPGSSEALANGQCLLFRRSAYELIGGHTAVLGSVIEDVALARVLKSHGLKTGVLRAERLGSVRMYDSLGAIWRGFQKNSFRFLQANPWSGMQVVFASVLATSYVPLIVWLCNQRRWALAAGWACLPSVLLAPWYGSFSEALFAPAAIYMFQLIALNGMLTTLLGRKAIWKGRHV